MRISIVVIVASNGGIGKDNGLLWRLPDDLKHFKAVTMGKPIVMGRKTYESIGRPLPGRVNIVISRQADLVIPGCVVADSLENAIKAAGVVDEVAIVGGAEIYKHALPLTNTIYMTEVHASIDADVFFPPLEKSDWRETSRQEHAVDERHPVSFSSVTLERIP
jgi:dihydrofolate reductase